MTNQTLYLDDEITIPTHFVVLHRKGIHSGRIVKIGTKYIYLKTELPQIIQINKGDIHNGPISNYKKH